MENNKRVIMRATEKYEFCCYLSDMGVERIYTVLAENEKDARERFKDNESKAYHNRRKRNPSKG